ncbi:hypothetical protein EW026_g6396 [Hermanssonia centrifuga]|uniref:Uncharacterized protein n=1 Tax=Hermanssonia centrifuga TaxID=98765 RepID=A0A4S4KB70_9APHY|nr:hypothetical protein EW026_g6396 [Hermanssonia centrifuga]
MPSSIPQLKYTAPVFVLLSIAGFYFIVLHMVLSHAPDRFLEVHEASMVPLSVTPKLPISILDKLFTPLVSFFVAAFGDVGRTSSSYPITLDFVWSFGAAIQLPLVEASRPGASSKWLLTIPMAWGILYQRVSGGWVLPLWLLVWMQSRSRAEGAVIEKLNAESILAGWWIGHTLPAMAMLIPGMPSFTSAPIWIAFPILMSLGQQAYLALARFVPSISNGKNGSGYIATQLVYLSSLSLSAIAHAHVVIIPGLAATDVPSTMSDSNAFYNKLTGLLGHIYAHYVPPSFAIPSPQTTTAITGVQHFVQFDVLIVFTAVWIAGLWDLALRRRQHRTSVGEIRWLARSALLLFSIGLVFGPGAPTAGLFAYREKMLEDDRHRPEPDQPEKDDEKLIITIESPPRTPRTPSFKRKMSPYHDQ